MLAIGLGKQKGAETCQLRAVFGQLAERIAAVGQTVLARGNVARRRLAVVENARRHQVHHAGAGAG